MASLDGCNPHIRQFLAGHPLILNRKSQIIFTLQAEQRYSDIYHNGTDWVYDGGNRLRLQLGCQFLGGVLLQVAVEGLLGYLSGMS